MLVCFLGSKDGFLMEEDVNVYEKRSDTEARRVKECVYVGRKGVGKAALTTH